MKRTLFTILTAAILAAMPVAAQPAPMAEWTVMVYLNADNNLEPFALMDFEEMAKVDYSNQKVNVLVQMDRNGGYTPWLTENKWSRTHRFKMRQGLTPTEANAIQGEDGLDDVPGGEVNMGDPQTLVDFVEWSRRNYPARKYFLVIWDHGQGWREPTVPGNPESDPQTAAVINPAAEDPFRSSYTSPYRSVSDDYTDGDHLFNREIQDALQPLTAAAPLDVLGFDACLMAMVEAAYSFRHLAKVMVASEELEPGTGWDYQLVLEKLVQKPELNGVELGKAVVASYKEAWTETEKQPATLSAIRLDTIEVLVERLSDLSDDLIDQLDEIAPSIIEARRATPVYAPNFFRDGRNLFQHVDLDQFLDEVSKRNPKPQTLSRIRLVREALDIAKIASESHLRDAWGNKGLAIYFPEDLRTYGNDAYEKGGYRKCNTIHTVEFVQRFRWADFIHAYLAKTAERE